MNPINTCLDAAAVPVETTSVDVHAEGARALFAPAETDSQWLVFRTKPRCEKKTAQVCRTFDIRHYLPLRWSNHRKGGRKYDFDVPIFNSYMFGCCTRRDRLAVLQSGYLLETIEVADQPRLLAELANVYLASNRVDAVILYPQLTRGRRVRMLRGPLQGVAGRISRRKEGLRLVLNVSILGTAVAAEVLMDDVEPV